MRKGNTKKNKKYKKYKKNKKKTRQTITPHSLLLRLTEAGTS